MSAKCINVNANVLIFMLYILYFLYFSKKKKKKKKFIPVSTDSQNLTFGDFGDIW